MFTIEVRHGAAADIGSESDRPPQPFGFHTAAIAEVEKCIAIGNDQGIELSEEHRPNLFGHDGHCELSIVEVADGATMHFQRHCSDAQAEERMHVAEMGADKVISAGTFP